MNTKQVVFAVAIVVGFVALVGCSGRPQILPNSDASLQKTSTEFAADAARRFPYKLNAPRAGDANARAQVGYALDVLEIENLSDEEWNDVELWINQEYVIHLSKMESHQLKHMTFQMIFNDAGKSFPTDNKVVQIKKLEMLRDGKMYDVKLQLAD